MMRKSYLRPYTSNQSEDNNMVEFNMKTAEATGKARAYIGNPQYGELFEMPVNYKNKPILMGKKKVAAVLLHLEEAKKFVAGELKAEVVEYTEKVTKRARLF